MRAFVLVIIAAIAPASLGAQAWDPAPLRSPTPIPRDGLPLERAAFFQWLRGSSLSPDDNQKARERVYTYVSETAKRDAGAFPTQGDTAALTLFRSAVSLGVQGADLILAVLDPQAGGSLGPIPPGLKLSLEPPVFTLRSDDSTWAVCFPYYFMPALAGRQTPNNGVLTEIAVLSTLVAPDSGESGASQATIFIAAAPIADSANHAALWTRQLGVNPVPAPGPSMPGQWFRSPEGERMHREAVIRRLPQRVVILAYVGLAGTYESNRPHFLDLLRTLAPNRCAA